MTQEYKLGGWNVVGALARSAIFSDVFFVDGDFGGSTNPGDLPNLAMDSITNAVDRAARGDVIYVRARNTTGSVQTYYLDNITIPITKPNLSILGAGSVISQPYMGGPLVKSTVAGAATNVVKVLAAGFVTEGMEWTGNNQTADTASVIQVTMDGTVGRAYGFTIRNCRIRAAKGHAIGAGAAIHIDQPIGMQISDCFFQENLCSIAFQSTYGAISHFQIRNCVFSGANTTRDVDIFCDGDAGSGILIDGCWFNDALPNHGVINRFIKMNAGISGMISNCHFAVSAASADGLFDTAGTQITVPATIFKVRNYYEGAATQEGLAADYT